MSEETPVNTEEAKASSSSSKTGGIIFTLIFLGIAVVLGLVIGNLIVGTDEADEPLDTDAVSVALDEGGCTLEQATKLENEASEVDDPAERGLAYQNSMDCYLQNSDFEQAMRVALEGEKAYVQAGLVEEAKQMERAAQAHELLLDFDPNEGGAGDEGDAI